ncbi:hypothetical protein CRUP_006113 [Coryphaenoides rupestris]|nr:hypothetical protein CRUP_006113 [Coryphaenoides rupestris]
MASAPALNFSESLRSSNLSVGTAEKRGFLGIFRFNSRKSKAEEAMDTDTDSVQSTEAPSNGLSTGSGVSEARPSTLGQSQSAMNLSRMSPKSDAKKRRAPGPPPTPMTTPTATPTPTPQSAGVECSTVQCPPGGVAVGRLTHGVSGASHHRRDDVRLPYLSTDVEEDEEIYTRVTPG